MATTAKATGYLELNISGFDQALKTAKNLMVTFAAGFTAYKLGKFFTDGTKDAINFGKEMQSLSRSMGGFDPGALLLVQKSLEKAGLGASEAQGHIGDFIREGRNISEIFGGSENYARSLKSAAQDYGSQADVLTRSGKALQTVWNTMEAIGSKVRTFFLTMTEQFVGPLQVALDYLNEMDLAGVGTAFGEAISSAANTLFGIFKNGDIFEVTKLGLTLAFQEATNWLAGGLNYIGNLSSVYIGEKLSSMFLSAVEILFKAIQFVFDSDSARPFIDSFVGIGAKIAESIMNAMGAVFGFIHAGMYVAIQSAIDAIPGLNGMLGMNGERKTFGELYERSSTAFDGFSKPVGQAGEELLSEPITKFNEFTDKLFKPGEAGKFEKGSIFDTSGDSAKLQDILAKGFKTGVEMSESAKKNNNNVAPKILTSFSGSSSRVIADSLARVGGGGGFLRTGMSLQERSAMQTAQATRQTAETLKAMHGESKSKPNRPQPLGR